MAWRLRVVVTGRNVLPDSTGWTSSRALFLTLNGSTKPESKVLPTMTGLTWKPNYLWHHDGLMIKAFTDYFKWDHFWQVLSHRLSALNLEPTCCSQAPLSSTAARKSPWQQNLTPLFQHSLTQTMSILSSTSSFCRRMKSGASVFENKEERKVSP